MGHRFYDNLFRVEDGVYKEAEMVGAVAENDETLYGLRSIPDALTLLMM